MAQELIFITGYFGAPIREEAERIASSKGWTVLDLDRLIEEDDGRSIARLCMMGGEHAYRNAEYEQVGRICSASESGESGQKDPGEEAGGLVIACGDGILYDEDTRKLILEHTLLIAGADLTPEELWQRARQDEATYHAFMKFGTDEEKRAAFEAHHQRQKALFGQVLSEPESSGQVPSEQDLS